MAFLPYIPKEVTPHVSQSFIELKRSKSTQQQLAERIGISHSSLQNKLQGRTQFTLKEMRDIQAVFADCSLDYLFSEYGSKRSLP